MARLGSVLGAILAELARARVVADHLSRDLVEEYRADPILASMSVPRVLLDQVELTLRFSVSDIVEAPVAKPADAAVAEPWIRHLVTTALPAALAAHGLSEAERAPALAQLVGSPETPTISLSKTVIRAAVAGNIPIVARTIANLALQSWTKLPGETRRKLGSKAALQLDIEKQMAAEAPALTARIGDLEFVRAALASRLDIAVRSPDLPSDAQKAQELKLTLRGDDLSLIVDRGG